jgi:multidrug efflux pump subunit AcrA (membrane-fusion protein)
MKLMLAAIAVFLVAGTATASAPGLTITLHGSGSVQPSGTVALGFPSGGRLASVDVRVGQHVARGQALARIDAAAARTAYANALSTLASARARVPQLRVALRQAQRALADTKAQIALDESTQQAAVDAAAKELDERRATRDSDQAALDAAAAALAAAKQKLADAQATQNGHQTSRADRAKQQTVHRNQLEHDQEAMASADVIANDNALLADDAVKLADLDRALTQDAIDVASAQASSSDAKAALDEAKQSVRDDDTAIESDAKALDSARQSLAAAKLKNLQSLHNAQNAVETAKLALPSTPDAVAAARAAAADARRALAQTTLRAPASGVVSEVHGAAGETAAGTVVTLVEDGPQEVQASFDEVDASKLRVGQTATVRLPSLDNQAVSARVTGIDPLGAHGKFDVTFALEQAPAGLLAGMTAEVDVTVAVG